MTSRLIYAIVFCCVLIQVKGQYFQKESRLINDIEKATVEKERIRALGALAEFYYIYRNERKGDSVLRKQLLQAELSPDTSLIRDALFGNALQYITENSTPETFDKAVALLNKAAAYAQRIGNDDYQAIASLEQAALFRKRGQYETAMQFAALALSRGRHFTNDSLKCCIYLEMGDILLQKREVILAYRHFNNAYDLADHIHNVPLLSRVYHHFSNLYQGLQNTDLARQNLLKSLELNLKHDNQAGLMLDYVDLARLTDEKQYFEKTLSLAYKLGSEKYQLYGKRLMLAYYMVVEKNSDAALAYLRSNEDLRMSYINSGTADYYWTIGNIYRYSGNMDSALHYYLVAEPALQKARESRARKELSLAMAESYRLTGNLERSMAYYEEVRMLSEQQKDLSYLANVTKVLGELYSQKQDFKKGFEYTRQHLRYKDTLQQLAAQRDVVLMEVDRENKKRERELSAAQAKSLRIRNLQYMGISIAVATILILLILSGMFPVSKTVVKMTGFVAFICLFEFIILLIDNWLHQLAHGEPLKIWLCKIVIIGLLLPLHHYIEHVVVQFLSSRQLVRLRQKISLRIRRKKIKKPPPEEVALTVEH